MLKTSKSLVILLVVALACSKDAAHQATAPLVPVKRIDVIPIQAAIYVGETQGLAAVTKDANGVVLNDRPITWSSSDTSIAKIDVNGLVRAVKAGYATLFAASEGATGSSEIWVMSPPPPPGQIARVDVFPVGAYLAPGETLQLTAVAKDVNGQVLTAGPVIWSSRNTSIMTVSPTGLVTAVQTGKHAVDATINGVTGYTVIEVTVPPAPVATVEVVPASGTIPVGGTLKLRAVTRDANGNVLDNRGVTWSSSDRAVATVNSSAFVSGVATGTVTITATSEGKTGTASVIVQ